MKRLLLIVVAATLSLPFYFWYQTWFGRHLSDAEIASDLRPEARGRDAQHALSQLAGVMERGDPRARRWYPGIAALSLHKNLQVRMMAAWAMGQDNQSPLFHQTLLTVLHDPELMVRRNAALALVRFGDARGRGELVQILQAGGDKAQVWEALRGLYVVGQAEDLAAVEAVAAYGGNSQRQAEMTAKAIRARSVDDPIRRLPAQIPGSDPPDAGSPVNPRGVRPPTL